MAITLFTCTFMSCNIKDVNLMLIQNSSNSLIGEEWPKNFESCLWIKIGDFTVHYSHNLSFTSNRKYYKKGAIPFYLKSSTLGYI